MTTPEQLRSLRYPPGYTSLNPHGYWPAEYEQQSQSEGWILSNDSDDCATISRIDCPTDHGLDYAEPKFDGDAAAQEFVISRAYGGSRMHMLAIYLTGFPVYQPLNMDVPDSIMPAELLATKRKQRGLK